jgi:hypothetical protein
MHKLPPLTPEQVTDALLPHVRRWQTDNAVSLSDLATDTHLPTWNAWQAFYSAVEGNTGNEKMEGKRTA